MNVFCPIHTVQGTRGGELAAGVRSAWSPVARPSRKNHGLVGLGKE
jgi:hypothetical protein